MRREPTWRIPIGILALWLRLGDLCAARGVV